MKVILLVLTLLGLLSCATNPVTGRSELRLVSESQEISIGIEQYPYQIQMAGGPYTIDPDLSAYVDRVGRKLAEQSERPHLPFEFTIINDSSWNAWALPGGKIAINRGLLEAMRNESELAAVLGHEIVHAVARHSAQRMERGMWMQAGVAGLTMAVESDLQDLMLQGGSMVAGITQLSYSRQAEREADYYGIRYMIAAGYDGNGAVTLQEMFAENVSSAGGWLASHPASIERVRRNRDALRDRTEPGYVGEAEYRIRTRLLRQRAPAYELYEQGLKALREKKPDQAHSLAREAQQKVPEEALFHALSAQAHEMQDNRRAALQSWDQAIRLNPEWFLFWLKRAQLNEKMNNRAQARSDFRQSHELLPTQAAKEGFDRMAARN